MKIILDMSLNSSEIFGDLRRTIVSFIKSAFSENNPNLYERFYGQGKAIQKPYAFDIYMNKPEFRENSIFMADNKLKITIITYDSCLAIDMYNCFVNERGKEYPMPKGNSMKIMHIKIQNHNPITKNKILIKMYSPMVVRSHNKEEKDRYYQFDDEGFQAKLNECVAMQLQNCGISNMEDTKICLEPVQAKKVLVKTLNIKIPASIGTYYLSGNIQVLNILYQSAIASKRTMGFGVFEVLA